MAVTMRDAGCIDRQLGLRDRARGMGGQLRHPNVIM
jgi:hypothetical protein